LFGAENGFKYLGIRLGRDDATHCQTGTVNNNGIPTNSCGYGGGYQQELVKIFNDIGVKWHELPIVDSEAYGAPLGSAITDAKVELDYLATNGALHEPEGPNEPNNFPFYYQGNRCDLTGSSAACAAYEAAFYAMIKADPLLSKMPVLGMTDVGSEAANQGLQHLSVQTSDTGLGTPPVGTKYADIANTHNYFQGNGQAGCVPIDNQIFWAENVFEQNAPNGYGGLWDVWGEYWGGDGSTAGSGTWNRNFPINNATQNAIPKETTETGWNTYRCSPPISDILKGHMIADLWFQAVLEGWSSTTVYQMNNNRPNDSGYGFFANDGASPIADATNALPMAIYTHNITTILADTSSAFTPIAIPYSIYGMPSTGYSMLLQKSDGTYDLVVWGEAFASQVSTPITVTLDKLYATINVYDPTVQSTPVGTFSNVSSLSLSISDHPVIVEF
jgi:hypothetical protein